jgi:hypothetical protein
MKLELSFPPWKKAVSFVRKYLLHMPTAKHKHVARQHVVDLSVIHPE